jgi:hypothetical protein
MTAFGKLEGLAGRLALMFHLIETPFAMHVSRAVMERVITIIKSYVIPVYRHLYDGDTTSGSAFDVWVTDYVVQYADRDVLTANEIRRGARRVFDAAGVTHSQEQHNWVYSSMEMLAARGWVALAPGVTRVGDPNMTWLINPSIAKTYADYRAAVLKAKAKQWGPRGKDL